MSDRFYVVFNLLVLVRTEFEREILFKSKNEVLVWMSYRRKMTVFLIKENNFGKVYPYFRSPFQGGSNGI